MEPLVKVEDFEAAALPHFSDLYRTALHISADRGKAEDLVQETYLQAWKSFHRFEPGTNCRAWLFTILFHVIQHDRRKWYRFRFDSISNEQTGVGDRLAYEPPVPERLTDEDVLAALEKIPQQYREVVLLADVEEFSYREIADILRIPSGTVMSRLSRGRSLLRTELARVAESYGIMSNAKVTRRASA